MSVTSRWRRTVSFKFLSSFLAALTVLPVAAGAWPAKLRRIWIPSGAAAAAAPTIVLARPAPSPPAPARPALVPRLIRQQMLEVVSAGGRFSDFDAWSWFDGSAARAKGGSGSVRVRATLPAPTKLIALSAWGGADGVLSLSIDRDGIAVPIEGLAGLDLSGQTDRWHTFSAVAGPFARTLVVDWQALGESSAPPELELWGLGAPPSGPPAPDLADELHVDLPPDAAEMTATPAAQIVPPARSGATF